MEKKPKCYMCGNRGDEPYYIWTKGNLYHISCYLDIDWNLFKEKYTAIKPEHLVTIIRTGLSDRDYEEYENNNNYINALIGRFYKELKVDPEILREQLEKVILSKLKDNK